ncbi:MAG: SRPBCC family protein [Chloroflexota bacterium]|nr:SRPBCC family protein [Chloroflexota bacterium]
MAEHRVSVDIAASPEYVFALWMNLDRMAEWVGGVTKVTDLSGPIDVAGTSYVVHFGPMKSPTEILEVDRPHHVRTRFGNLILKGESEVRFEPTPTGTRLTQVFRTRGVISALTGRLFAAGSHEGSFKGELEKFRTIAESGLAHHEAPKDTQ